MVAIVIRENYLAPLEWSTCKLIASGCTSSGQHHRNVDGWWDGETLVTIISWHRLNGWGCWLLPWQRSNATIQVELGWAMYTWLQCNANAWLKWARCLSKTIPTKKATNVLPSFLTVPICPLQQQSSFCFEPQVTAIVRSTSFFLPVDLIKRFINFQKPKCKKLPFEGSNGSASGPLY